MAGVEREGGKPPSPFDRLAERFNKLPEPQDSRLKGQRTVELEDGTVVSIRGHCQTISGSSGIDSFDVSIQPPGYFPESPNSLEGQIFHFSINRYCLFRVNLPDLMIKIGNTEVFNGRLSINPNDRSRDDSIDAAEKLVTWLDKIMQEGKYEKPPISVSIFR